MNRRTIPYSDIELAWIKAHSKDSRRQAHQRFCALFGRNDVSLMNFNALCKRHRWLTRRTGRFQKGHAPYNKGKDITPHPNSAKTQFKKGHIPRNLKPLGHERIRYDGYIEICVDEPNPYTGAPQRYVLKHKHLWEKVNGPLPRDLALKSLDGNRQNCDLSNWVAVPRSLLPRLNGRFGRNYDTAPKELKPVILTIAKLEHQARENRRNLGGTRQAAVSRKEPRA